MKNLLSVVINCRNDNYHKNFTQRFEKSLDLNLTFLEKIRLRECVKFTIVDWGSEEPLSNEVKINSDFNENVNFYYVPKELAKKYSQNQPGGFYPEKSGNLGFRKSDSKFILYTGSDQIFSKFGWFNTINLLKNNYKLDFNIEDVVFYVPRKFLELDFFRKSPSNYIYERYLDLMNFSAVPYKTPTFYIGGGYSTLCSTKIINKITGFDETYEPGNATDIDFHNRIKKLSLEQIDCSNMGINMFKFPSEPDSNRQKLLYSTNLTRQVPANAKKTSPNDENWGLNNHRIEVQKSQKILNSKTETDNPNNQFFNETLYNDYKTIEKLRIISSFEKINFNFKEWKFIFTIIKLIRSARIFSLIEFGFDNINRTIAFGKNIKHLEIIEYDNNCFLPNNDYKNRLFKIQRSLSNSRYGKLNALSSDNIDEFITNLKNIPSEPFTSIFILNFKTIKSNKENIKKIEKLFNDYSNMLSFIVIKDLEENNQFIEEINKLSFELFLKKDRTYFFVNKRIMENKNDIKRLLKLIEKIYDKKLVFLGILFFFLKIFNFFSFHLKKLNYKIFKFKYF